MKKRILYIAYFILLLSATSCRQVTLELSKLPNNTPKGAKIYVTGSFNNWNPADPNYLMKYDESTKSFEVNLPLGFGSIEYKFTRGDWTTGETDACGGYKPNRKLLYGQQELQIDTIDGWYDLEPENCTRVTIILSKIPANTPASDRIYLGGDLNGWQCNNKQYEFKEDSQGRLFLTIPRNGEKADFKLTRGTWESAELNEEENEQLQREIYFGKEDTVFISVKAWADIPIETIKTKTIIIQSLPQNTPDKGDIFMASNLNNWNPLDVKSKFLTLPNGKKAITIKYTSNNPVAYKITRGGWQKVETSKNNEDIENRLLGSETRDTIYIQIDAWADLIPPSIKQRQITPVNSVEPKRLIIQEKRTPSLPKSITPQYIDYDKSKKVFLIIEKMPETDKAESIYLAGDFNGWNDKDPLYKFRLLPNGKMFFLLRVADNNAHEYKITRGDWQKEEATINMDIPANRKIAAGSANDTIHIRIDNWIDLPPVRKLIMLLADIPKATPEKDNIYLTGDFNNWDVKDERYKFMPTTDGRKVLEIEKFNAKYGTYKITRGSWPTEATSKRGRTPQNQQFNYIKNDTIKIRIEKWRDIEE